MKQKQALEPPKDRQHEASSWGSKECKADARSNRRKFDREFMEAAMKENWYQDDHVCGPKCGDGADDFIMTDTFGTSTVRVINGN